MAALTLHIEVKVDQGVVDATCHVTMDTPGAQLWTGDNATSIADKRDRELAILGTAPHCQGVYQASLAEVWPAFTKWVLETAAAHEAS